MTTSLVWVVFLHSIYVISVFSKKAISSVYIFGCNRFYQTSIDYYVQSSHCWNESDSITFPTEIISPDPNSHIVDACSGTFSTLLHTDSGHIYVAGLLSFIESDPTPAPFFTLIHKDHSIKRLICGGNSYFYEKYDGKIYGFGKNEKGEVCTGELDRVSTPTLILSQGVKHFQVDLSVSLMSNDEKTVKVCGRNLFYQLGRNVNQNFEYLSVDMDLISQENSKIKFISLFRLGVYLVLDSNTVFVWGQSEYSINPPILEFKEIFTPKKVNFFFPDTDVPVGSDILSITCQDKACFCRVLTDNKVEVYSWGYGNSAATNPSEYLGRQHSLVTWFYPVKINKGEIGDDEFIVEISVMEFCVKLLSNKNHLYVFGLNRASGMTNAFSDLHAIQNPTRILKSFIDEIVNKGKEFHLQSREQLHSVLLFKEYYDDLSWIVYLVVPSLLLVVIFVIFVIVIIIFAVISVLKNNKKSQKVDKSLPDFSKLDEEEVEMSKRRLAKLEINEDLFKVKASEVKLIDTLGKGGSNATIYKGLWYEKEVAVKMFLTNLFGDQHDFDEFEKEVQITSSLSHPNIIRFYGVSLNPPKILILMEFAELGDIQYFISIKKHKKEEIPLKLKLKIIIDTLKGLSYMHNLKIIHRDMKPQNVLLKADGESIVAKLIDFGLSRVIKTQFSRKTARVGTSMYMSPEVVVGGKYDTKADIFSLAMIFFVLLEEELINPYKNSNVNSNAIEISVSQDPNLRPVFENEEVYDKQIIELIKNWWSHDPNSRMTTSEALEKIEEIEKKIN